MDKVNNGNPELKTTGKYLNLCNATFLSIIFFLIYIPYNITQNTMSTILQKNFGRMGFFLVATQSFCSMLGGILAPYMLKKVGWKTTFIIGGIGFCIVVVEQILPAWYDEVQSNPDEVNGKWYSFLVDRNFVEVSNFFSNVIAGFGLSFIWVA